MNCILHFENHQKVVDEFADEHLWPQLEERGKRENTGIEWVPYTNPDDSQGPAQDAVRRIAANGWDKVALVVDMDAKSGNTPQVQFGLDMLLNFAQLRYANVPPTPLDSLLSDPTMLCCVLSIFTPQFMSVVQDRWPQPIVNHVTFIEPDRTQRNIDLDTNRALALVAAGGQRIVVADRLTKGEWLAMLVAKWL